MFTGIIEETGTVQSLVKGSDSARIRINAPLIVSDVKTGDSIAVNGICLTVVAFDTATFTAEAMAETMAKTNLGDLQPGQKVNLERALRLSDRLGGHLVSGHVDGIGTVVRQTKHDIAVVYEITCPPVLAKYLVPKGSIAVDGISLTIIEVKPQTFTVSLIPHTRGVTAMSLKKVGDKVNLEGDVLAKYLEKLTADGNREKKPATSSITATFLARHGFKIF